jgi:hypothetical protein
MRSINLPSYSGFSQQDAERIHQLVQQHLTG